MLRFKTLPDRPFMAIVLKSIEVMIEQIEEFVLNAPSGQEERDNFQWFYINSALDNSFTMASTNDFVMFSG